MDTQKSGIHKTESRFRAGSESQREWIRKLIAPTVRWIAAQDRALIRQALGEEADQVLDALAAGTEELEDTVCQRVEALLPELLRGEVHRVIEEAISGVEGMLAGPLDHGGQSVKALRSRGQIAGPVGGWGDTAEDDDKGPSGGDDTETAFVSAGLTRHQASERLGASRPVEADAPAELLS